MEGRKRGSAGTLFRVHDRRGQRSLSGVMQEGSTDRMPESAPCRRSCCKARGQVHVKQLSAKGKGRGIKEGTAALEKTGGEKGKGLRCEENEDLLRTLVKWSVPFSEKKKTQR